jgi:hypothetical protein
MAPVCCLNKIVQVQEIIVVPGHQYLPLTKHAVTTPLSLSMALAGVVA